MTSKEQIVNDNKRQSDDSDKDALPKWLKISLVFVSGVALSILILYFSKFNGPLGTQETLAQFGDFIGGTLNPILGFATIGLLIWSIRIQLKELRATRQEASDSRLAFQEQLRIARDETLLKQMQMTMDHFVKERKILLNRSISLNCVELITESIYDLMINDISSGFGKGQRTLSEEREAIHSALKNVNYDVFLQSIDSFRMNGINLPGEVTQQDIRKLIVDTLVKDMKANTVITTYLYCSLQIAKVMFDYHNLTMYKKFIIMNLFKESSEHLQKIKHLIEKYEYVPAAVEFQDELNRRIEEISELDIFS